jgi:hypothetical protein
VHRKAAPNTATALQDVIVIARRIEALGVARAKLAQRVPRVVRDGSQGLLHRDRSADPRCRPLRRHDDRAHGREERTLRLHVLDAGRSGDADS